MTVYQTVNGVSG